MSTVNYILYRLKNRAPWMSVNTVLTQLKYELGLSKAEIVKLATSPDARVFRLVAGRL
jgi:hypothetical protein